MVGLAEHVIDFSAHLSSPLLLTLYDWPLANKGNSRGISNGDLETGVIQNCDH